MEEFEDQNYDPYDSIPFGDAQRWEDEQVAQDREWEHEDEDAERLREQADAYAYEPEVYRDKLFARVDQWVKRASIVLAIFALWYFGTHVIVEAVCG